MQAASRRGRQEGKGEPDRPAHLEQVRDPVLRRMDRQRLARLNAEILLIGKRLTQIVATNPRMASKDRLPSTSPTGRGRDPLSTANRLGPGEGVLGRPL